jgi:endonuclease III
MKSPAVARRIIDAIARHYPDADTELHYKTPFELLVATMLSAQSTDARVNLVTPALFARYPDAESLAEAEISELEGLIRATGFFRQKSRALIGMSTALVNEHDGSVPASMDALTRLPGVGRKTANVVLGHALGVPGLPVDRHVLRVTNRLGLVRSDDPVKVEAALTKMVPPERWTKTSDSFILHGRRICRPTPLCPRCNARKDCDFALSGTVTKLAKGRRPAPARAAAKKRVRR